MIYNFLIFAQNLGCGYTLEYPQSMFWSKNKKNRHTLAYPFHYIKVGYKGVYISRTCFPDVFCIFYSATTSLAGGPTYQTTSLPQNVVPQQQVVPQYVPQTDYGANMAAMYQPQMTQQQLL